MSNPIIGRLEGYLFRSDVVRTYTPDYFTGNPGQQYKLAVHMDGQDKTYTISKTAIGPTGRGRELVSFVAKGNRFIPDEAAFADALSHLLAQKMSQYANITNK